MCLNSITVSVHCTLTGIEEDNFANVETGDSSSVMTFTSSPSTSFTGLGTKTVSAGVAGGEVATASTASLASLTAYADGVTSNSLSITVNALPSITTTSLPGATQSGVYSQTLANTGGTSPFAWTETGALPSGLALSSAGVISGTVSGTATVQAYPFTATLTDADGVTATKALSITVNAKPVITTTTLPAVDQGQTTYSQTLAGSAGTTSYTWTETGALPSGLTLSSAGVISGTVSGTATVQAYPFTATLTDANGVTATQALSITVNAKPVHHDPRRCRPRR